MSMTISQRDADLLIHESTGGKDVGEVLLRRRGHRYMCVYMYVSPCNVLLLLMPQIGLCFISLFQTINSTARMAGSCAKHLGAQWLVLNHISARFNPMFFP